MDHHRSLWIMDLGSIISYGTQKMPSYCIVSSLCILCMTATERSLAIPSYHRSWKSFESELGKAQYNSVFCGPSVSGREKADKAVTQKMSGFAVVALHALSFLTDLAWQCQHLPQVAGRCCRFSAPIGRNLKAFAPRLACQAQFLREVYDVTFTGGSILQGEQFFW